MSTTTKFPPTFANQTGSQLIAAFVNSVFYGIALLVTLQYFRRHSRGDSLYVKLGVSAMIVLATLQTIFVNHEMYRTLIAKHTTPVTRDSPIEWPLAAKFICVYLITFIAQLFFASRIWVLTQNVARWARVSIIFIVGLAITQLVAGSLLVNMEATAGTLAELGKHGKLNKTGTAVQGGATAAADVVITLTLIYLYNLHRSSSQKVNSIVDRLAVYAINRAAATSICAILGVAFFFGLRGTYYFIVPTLMTGQLYVISAVTVLTSREALREDVDAVVKEQDDGSVTKHEHKGYTNSEKSV
ncbi:hypothetical protein D9611_006600 [Ephemerocybe angulata]|uniref:DUF6534 domain-containing protein n=1 Tax=Ephemerocybe angulata TaxID=980116 RepID=A0A8H5C9F0_9AGAR|nr:hypothetical protein D9611_006600 [Tulosesus angulatus]